MQPLKKHTDIEGQSFEYTGFKETQRMGVWGFKSRERTIFYSDSIQDADEWEALALLMGERERIFLAEHLLPDEDFDLMRMEKLAFFNWGSSHETSLTCFTVSTPPPFYPPLDKRLAGQSASDFMKFFQMEQAEGLLAYARIVGRKIEKILSAIAPEEFERYEMEWKLKDVMHEIHSPLLSLVQQEIGKAFNLLSEKGLQKAELLNREKNLLRLRVELQGFLLNHLKALKELSEALERMVQKERWAEQLHPMVIALTALYEEVLHDKEPSHSNWARLTLLLHFLERQEVGISLLTSPKNRRTMAPFLLRCSLEGVALRFSPGELIDAILRFEKLARSIQKMQLKGSGEIKERSALCVLALQKTFYRQSQLFSNEIIPPKKQASVLDFESAALLPAFGEEGGRAFPLIRIDDSSPEKAFLTEEGERAFNF